MIKTLIYIVIVLVIIGGVSYFYVFGEECDKQEKAIELQKKLLGKDYNEKCFEKPKRVQWLGDEVISEDG